jgi:hypothetical protein
MVVEISVYLKEDFSSIREISSWTYSLRDYSGKISISKFNILTALGI